MLWNTNVFYTFVYIIVYMTDVQCIADQASDRGRNRIMLTEIRGNILAILQKLDSLDVQQINDKLRTVESNIAVVNTKVDRLAATLELNKVSSSVVNEHLVRLDNRMKSLESSVAGQNSGNLVTKVVSMENVMTQWEEKLRKLMNIITQIYEFNNDLKKIFTDIKVGEKPPEDTDLTIADLLAKMKEQMSVVSIEIRSHTDNIGSKVMGLRTQLDQMTTQLIEIKDDLPSNRNKGFALNVPTFQPSLPKCPAVNASEIKAAIIESTSKVSNQLEFALKTMESRMEAKICENLIPSKPAPFTPQIETSHKVHYGYQRPDGGYLNTESNHRRPEGKSFTRSIRPVVGSAMPKAASGCTKATMAMHSDSCSHLRTDGKSTCDGIYVIVLRGRAVKVYCDMTDGLGGWTVFMRRGNFSAHQVDFDRDWNAYKHGFGDQEDEFWLGNEYLHQLTSGKSNELQIDLESFDGETISFKYESFSVASESDGYRLTVGRPKTPQVDSTTRIANLLLQHSGSKFSTKDRNNNVNQRENCADKMKGGWWFNHFSCNDVFLTGPYFEPNNKREEWQGIQWPSWKRYQPLKAVQMKIRAL